MPDDFIDKFKEVDKSDITDFTVCERLLDKALWVLCISKEKIGQKRLTVEDIISVLLEVEEISVNKDSITKALNRALDKVHRSYVNSSIYYEIMRPGKEYLLTLQKKDIVNVFYFKPETRYSSKGLLKNQIFNDLSGDIRIVDPYCSERTLDLLATIEDRPTKLLTSLANLSERNKNKLTREYADFKTENPHIELRNYPNTDIHDRYIISDDKVVLIGHSIKDLGSKESFSFVLPREHCQEIYDALNSNFSRRWNISSAL